MLASHTENINSLKYWISFFHECSSWIFLAFSPSKAFPSAFFSQASQFQASSIYGIENSIFQALHFNFPSSRTSYFSHLSDSSFIWFQFIFLLPSTTVWYILSLPPVRRHYVFDAVLEILANFMKSSSNSLPLFIIFDLEKNDRLLLYQL